MIFSLQLCLTLSKLHFFIAEIRSIVSQLLTSSIILKIFSKSLKPWEQQKLVLTCFNLENITSSLALETETVNNNLIINSTLIQPLLLSVVKILRHVTRYKTPAREKVVFEYYINSYHCSKRSGIDAFIQASFNGIRNC